MTKYLMLLAALFALIACGGEEDNWVTDQAYAGLEWSPLSENTMNWQEAMDYCDAMGARLPNIDELRKIIINCPGSTYGGACQVSDPDCLGSECRKYEDCRCDGTAASYSALGDGKNIWLWSSSSRADGTSNAWYVYFDGGYVSYDGKTYNLHARCVR